MVNPDGIVFHAGFPNASEDADSLALSLDTLVVRHKASTFFWRLDSAGVPELGWEQGDIAVVDRSLIPKNQDWIVAVLHDEFVLRRLVKVGPQVHFMKPNGENELSQVIVWGVMTYIVHRLGRTV